MPQDNSKTAIVYFTLSGTTRRAAEAIHTHLPGSALIELKLANPYKGYDDASHRGDTERQQNIHPALASVPDLSAYSTVFVGYPIWWAVPPMVIHTLFDKADFSGKRVVPFATSMSTPMEESMPVMRSLANAGHAHLTSGFRWNGDDRALTRWLSSLGFKG